MLAELSGNDKEEFYYTLWIEGEYRIKLTVIDSSSNPQTKEKLFQQTFDCNGKQVTFLAEILTIEIENNEIEIELIEPVIEIEIMSDLEIEILNEVLEVEV